MKTKGKVAAGLLAATLMTPNVLAEEFIYGEDIPAGTESDYVLQDKEIIKEAEKDLTEEEALSLKVEYEKSKYTKVTINKYQVKTGVEVDTIVEKEFESFEDALEYVKALEEEGYTITNTTFVNDIEKEELIENFDSYEEALKALEKFKEKYSENFKGEIAEEQEADSEAITENKENLTKEEVDTLKESEKDTHKEKVEVITKRTYEVVVNTLTESTTETFISAEKAQAYIDGLLENGYDVSKMKVSVVTHEETKNLDENYKTEDAAEKALQEFLKAHKDATGSYKEKKEADSEAVVENKDNLTKKEADTIKATEVNNHDLIITVTVEKYEVDTNEDDIIDEVIEFENLTKLEEYLTNLRNNKYNITKSDNSEIFTTKKVILSVVKGDKGEADKILADFIEAHPGATGSVTPVRNTEKDEKGTKTLESSQDTLEKAEARKETIEAQSNKITKYEAEIEKVIVKAELSDAITRTFETEEEAEAAIEALKKHGYIIPDGNYVTKEEKKVILSVDLNPGTNTRQITDSNRANLYVRVDGKVQHETGSTQYDTSEYRYVGEVAVSNGSWYDLNADKHQGDLAYLVDVNNNIGNHIINTSQLSGMEDYLKKYGITLDEDEVIVWYVLKGAADSQGQTHSYDYLDENGNKVIVSYDKNGKPRYKQVTQSVNKCNYHIDGVIMKKSALENIYKVSGSVQKIDKYNVFVTPTTLGYDYEILANGTERESTGKYSLDIEASKDIMETKYKTTKTTIKHNYSYDVKATGKKVVKDGYIVENEAKKDIKENRYDVEIKTTKHNYNYHVEASGEKTLKSGKLSADTEIDIIEDRYSIDIEKERYSFVGGVGSTNEENPNTADESLWIFTLGGFSMIGLAATASKIKKEKNKKIEL